MENYNYLGVAPKIEKVCRKKRKLNLHIIQNQPANLPFGSNDWFSSFHQYIDKICQIMGIKQENRN